MGMEPKIVIEERWSARYYCCLKWFYFDEEPPMRCPDCDGRLKTEIRELTYGEVLGSPRREPLGGGLS